MNPSSLSSQIATIQKAFKRSTNRWRFGRCVWLIAFVMTTGYFVVYLPPLYQGYQLQCTALKRTFLPDLFSTPGLSVGFCTTSMMTLALIFSLIWSTVGVFLFYHIWRYPNKRVDLLVLLVSFALVTSGLVIPLPFPLRHTTETSALLWSLFSGCIYIMGQMSFTFLLFLLPDGHLAPRWMLVPVVIPLIFLLCLLFFPNWYFLPLVGGSSQVLFTLVVICGAVSQLYKYSHSSDLVQREQTRWLVFGCTTISGVSIVVHGIFGFFGYYLLPFLLANTLFYIGGLVLPFSIVMAILRYQLWEINVIVNRALLYGALTGSVVGLYVLVVGGLGTLLQAQGNLLLSLLATGMTAILFHPLRIRLQQAINRLIYGERDDPYEVLSRLGQRIETTLAPGAVLPTIVETVVQALNLPYAAITMKQEQMFTIAAAHGKEQDKLIRLPLVYQREPVGELVLAPRLPDEALTASDQRLLNDLARQAGAAVHALRLTIDLQRSRERLVATREEERRRLRRNLHDELGPTLSALSLKVGAVRNLLPAGQPALEIFLDELSCDIEHAVKDIRRMAYDLRPPALDELGLVGAIRTRATQYELHSQKGDFCVVVEAPETLSVLPAAVEVAAYWIAQEALANTVRHADAHTCHISLAVKQEGLYLQIRDDGIGLPVEHHRGIGLISMRERATELGGTCTIEQVLPHGTRVRAFLPFQATLPSVAER